MAPAVTDLTSLPDDVGHTPWNQRVRSLLLGPHGGGTSRRRASDAVRVGIAAVLVLICIPLVQANTALEIHVADLLSPPPTGIQWLITAIWFAGSIGLTVALILIGLLVPRLNAVRQMGAAGLAALLVCLLLDALLGPAAGRPPIADLSGFNPRFPILQLSIATAVALAGLPYLSRPMRRIVISAIGLAGICAVVGSYGLPLAVIAAVIVGWGTAAACHLVMGAPNGLPSAAEVTDAVRDLQVEVRGLSSPERQEWGVASFAGTDAEGRPIELAVYGRDAADAQWLRKVWRFCIYRDSGPTLVLNRLQQVEHEAYLTFLADHAGTLVPEIVAAGRCGPAHDAALVTRLPEGRRLSDVQGEEVSDDDLDAFLRSVLALRQAGIAHGALSPETVVITSQGPLLRDFRRASSSAPPARTDRDLAAAVAAASVVVGVERGVASTCRVLDPETIQAVLTLLQRSTLDTETERMARSQKGFLKALREALAAAAGVEVPKLVESKRISWPNLLMVVGSLVGLWLIIGVLTEASGSISVIRGADWKWVAAAFVLAQLPVVTGAWQITGAVKDPLPFGRCVVLETSNLFTSFVGGSTAVFAVRVRFFQRQGLDAPAAVSSGAIAGTASWVIKALLLIVCLPFAVGDFHKPTSSETGGHEGIVWIILIVVLAIAVLVAVVTLVPKVRQVASEKARPHLVTIWSDIKEIAVEPRKIAYVLGGCLGSQVLIALCLGASLHAVGEHANFATLIVVLTLAAMIGGAVPVPGGAGVIEIGLIAGLTAAGIPQDQAVAAVFIERFCTAYLTPIWGWAALVWLRRSDYI
ncbi:MAG TPA: lysylphosphatidylglycerol synthase domain-containing protein [Acidimicrobiales bacterium]|nr:lysylphosphatidylglycerol synthase domain-containing protein [Acidimicrobiales bacterium]